jgi:hypothetical protein
MHNHACMHRVTDDEKRRNYHYKNHGVMATVGTCPWAGAGRHTSIGPPRIRRVWRVTRQWSRPHKEQGCMHGSGTRCAVRRPCWRRKRRPDRSNDKHARDDICRPRQVPRPLSHTHPASASLLPRMHEQHQPVPSSPPCTCTPLAWAWTGHAQDTSGRWKKEQLSTLRDRELSCARHSGERHTSPPRGVGAV